MQFIFCLISMTICAIIFTVIKKWIFKRVKKNVRTSYLYKLLKKDYPIFTDEYKKLQKEVK